MNTKEFKRRAVRHGEIMLIPVDKLPEGLEQIEQGREIIVGHSESGHNHVAVATADDLIAFRPVGADSPDLYLQVISTAKVEHRKAFDKHETKTLAPGYYHVATKMAYDYFAKVLARVVD